MPKAIALLSGGLDSLLAILLLRKQNINVTAVTFLMHFGCDMSDGASCTTDATSISHQYGFKVKMCHLADKFTEIVKNPKYGHGKNMNPCLDCRILMLREAKELMRMMGADFIATGEVEGQRPMSQRRDTFPVIDREAGLKGMVLRPLSAKLMKPTIPELDGMVDREQLMDFRGRSRKPQMALAREFGLTEYPAPAGGCLLTEPIYSFRLKELLDHVPDPTVKDLNLLRLGRQYRFPEGQKFVVGRDERDNMGLETIAGSTDWLIDLEEFGSPTAIVDDSVSDKDIRFIAGICARYSRGRNETEVKIVAKRGEEIIKFNAAPVSDELASRIRITEPKED
ncbi:hypothetical protein ACFLZI_01420 [Nitrospirota bacterium]